MKERNPPRARGHTEPVRVLFINDHLGYADGVTTGGVTYLLGVLPRLDRGAVLPMLCACRASNPNAERFRRVGIAPVFLARGKWDPRVLSDLVRLIREHRIDVLHLNGMKSHLLGRVAAMITGTRAIIHLHFLYTPRPAWLQPWLARATGAALAVSEPLRQQAVHAFRIPAERAIVLHNGIDTSCFGTADAGARAALRRELDIAEGAPLIIAPGRITTEPDKGHAALLRAMRDVRERCRGAVLLVVGDGPARADCEALARELGLARVTRFTGQRDDIPQLLAAADVVALPSLVAEALPYVALEAAAAARPVVAFDVGGTGEIVLHERSGQLVPRGDERAFGDALVRLLDNPQLARRFGDTAREHSQRFSLAHHVQTLQDIYSRLIDDQIL